MITFALGIWAAGATMSAALLVLLSCGFPQRVDFMTMVGIGAVSALWPIAVPWFLISLAMESKARQ